MQTQDINPLLCDIETGMCEMLEVSIENQNDIVYSSEKTVKIIYFTDPICSSC